MEKMRHKGSDIIENKIKKFSLNNVSILVRAIYQTREFEEISKIGLGYRDFRDQIYRKSEIKDAISYLKIVTKN